jgi:hypothetical protein
MRTRLEYGSLPDDVQIEAAREAENTIEDGEILRAWPDFRALGERQQSSMPSRT